METPRIMLLQIFAAWPPPAPPQCTIFLPIFSSTGFAAAKALSSPPHMKVSVAPLAPPVPPETGASTERTPCSEASAWACTALSTSMVEQSMISAPLVIAGSISVHTERTCLPAGSIVITTSAPFTALTALSAITAPSAFACLREASTKSKPVTLSPALTRLAAIGPPMLPSPMNAMLAMSSSLRSACLFYFVEYQFVGADFGEVRRDHLGCDILDPRRRPAGIAILVDQSRPHAFAKIVAGKYFQRGAIFPHQALFERGRCPPQPQQFQGHHHAARRLFIQCLQCRLRQLRTIPVQGCDDISHPVVGEPGVDARLKRRDRSRCLAGRETIDRRFHVGR